MDKNNALQNLLNGTASEEDINLLKGGLASGEISIGGNVNQSVIIIGSGNTVELPPAALDKLGGRSLLGDLDRDLTGDEIAAGLNRLEAELPLRAPILLTQLQEQTRRLRPSLKTNPKSLSDHARRELVEVLAQVNSLCMEALDISFNALCLGEEPPEYDSRSPFRGLESFRPEDSEFFFGREALTKKLVAKIQSHPFLAVLGASGSGKSSLVMAGLIPALGSEYIIFRPGTNPLEALESVKENALVVVDQFEELFTLTRDEEARKEFITKLLETTNQNKVVITLRSDFLGEVGTYRSLKEEIQSHLEIVPPMDMDELRRAMEGQAGVVGLRFEADLSQQILDDVEGEPGAMPLLQHALWELWNRRHGRNLRASEYRAFGGVKQAITSTAEKVYGECAEAEQKQMRDIFLRLTRLDENDEGRDTRRRLAMSNLIPSRQDATSITLLLDKLANARLIVKTANEDKTEIEVAHEALIRYWERLRGWLTEDRDNLRLRESVSEDAKEWENVGKDEALLNHRSGRLDDALSLGDNSRYSLTTIEQAYLNACVALRNKEQREREQRLRWTVTASIAAAIIFLALAGFSWLKSNEATNQAKIALSRQLAAQAQSIFTPDHSKQTIAVLLAVRSMQLFPVINSAQVLQNNKFAYLIARMAHDGSVTSVAFSSDGKYVVSGSVDGTARVWEASTGVEIARMAHDGSVNSVAFSSDGKYVVSGSSNPLGDSDTTVRIWETTTGKEVARMTHDGGVNSVAFSPDGKYVVSGSDDLTARVWEAATGKEIARMTHGSYVLSVAFSPDGKYVVSGSVDGTARVWEATTGKEIALMPHDDAVNSVAFSPDNKYVVSGGGYTALVWMVAPRLMVASMNHSGLVLSVAFSPDSEYIVSGSVDGTARVLEVDTDREISRMTHDGPVDSVAFSPDGNYVVSGNDDQLGSSEATARVWETITGKEVARITHDGGVNSVAFSPDGKYVVSGSSDGTDRLWKVATGDEVARMIHNGYVTSVASSPDGKYVVSGSNDHTACVWETTTGVEVAHMTHDGRVNSVAFSPDGKYVVSGSVDGTARVWEATTGKEIARMTHENDVYSVAFSPDGKYVVTKGCYEIDKGGLCVSDIVRVWEAATGKEVTRRITDKFMPSAVIISPDGKYLASGCAYYTTCVQETTTGKEVIRIIHKGAVFSVASSPDGKYVVSGSNDHTARIWEAATGVEVAHMTHDGGVNSVAFSPDGKYVVSGSVDGTARVWEATTGKEIARMTHENDVYSVAFSPDGKYVVTKGCYEIDKGGLCVSDIVRVWEAATGIEVARMQHGDIKSSVIFSSDNQYVVSGSSDGIVRVWAWRGCKILCVNGR